jgi:hypothetical protein
MKPATRSSLIGLSVAAKQEVVALLSQHLEPGEFVEALADGKGNLTEQGAAIQSEISDDDDPKETRDAWLAEVKANLADQFTPIHEAICEGRKQDALDLLFAIVPTGVTWRTADVQNHLFPHRVILDF